MILRRLLVLFIFLGISGKMAHAQRVGLVLSGGGASGIAHIGVIKALEHDSIPIDYITGTSMGALIGALYAMGYSPEEMEKIVASEEFRNWAYGRIDEKYIYFFKKKEDDASWITLKLSLDSAIETTLPTNLVSPIPLDFALMEVTAPPIAAAHYNFDSLFIPYRCLASDIEAKKNVIFREGDLGVAVRASMSYPFYLKPVLLNGKLLYDGGIYNNFPANVMYDDFYPDIIIGSNVSSNDPPPDEDNLLSQMKTMLLTKTDFNIVCENGIIIEPRVNDAPTFNFDNLQRWIDSGYVAALPKIRQMKQCITRRTSPSELQQKRKAFREKERPLVFGQISVEGVKKNQEKYVQRLLGHHDRQLSLDKLKPEYFKLASDEKIKSIFPTTKLDPSTGLYDLHLKVKKEKDLFAEFGGNFSNRPISEGFVGLQYNYLGQVASSAYANAYFGKLYASGQVRLRFDFPSRHPVYFEPVYTVNKWDFFKSSAQFVTDIRPSFLVQYEQYAIGNFGLPAGHKGKLVAGAGYAWLTDRYYQTDKFTQKDTSDKTDFNFFTAHATFEMNSHNRKQYASQGRYFSIRASYVNGQELFVPGSTSLIRSDTFTLNHSWFLAKLVYDKYFRSRTFYKTGIYVEGVFSTQDFFHNYTSSVLAAPAFQPLPESKTLFQEKFRAHKYIAAGVRQIFSYKNICDLRLEAYYYQPYQQIVRGSGLVADYTKPFFASFFIGTAALVVHTPLGPAAVSTNYYYGEDEPFTFLFHFGYIIFNKRTTEQ
jgi:NTE family protein